MIPPQMNAKWCDAPAAALSGLWNPALANRVDLTDTCSFCLAHEEVHFVFENPVVSMNLLRQYLQGIQGMPMHGGTFEVLYTCWSLAFRDRDTNTGGKILLPPSALQRLEMYEVDYPLTFELSAASTPERKTHAGVYEFTADEGNCFMPYWMMRNMGIDEGAQIRVKYVRLPKGKKLKLQAQTLAFLDISNPRAVLEKELRGFAALTKGDIIVINYNEQNYPLKVVDTEPGSAIATTDTDLFLDFDEPLGYVAPVRPQATPTPPPTTASQKSTTPVPSSTEPTTSDAKDVKSEMPPPPQKQFPAGGFRLRDGQSFSTAPLPQAKISKTEPTTPTTPAYEKPFPTSGGFRLKDGAAIQPKTEPTQPAQSAPTQAPPQVAPSRFYTAQFPTSGFRLRDGAPVAEPQPSTPAQQVQSADQAVDVVTTSTGIPILPQSPVEKKPAFPGSGRSLRD